MAIQLTSRIADACSDAGQKELAESINDKVTGYYTTYMNMQVPAGKQ
jgi:ribosomal protein S6